MAPVADLDHAVAITDVRTDGARVVATVDGTDVWFASDDAALTPAPEVFGSAVAVAAAAHGRGLRLDAPVTDRWQQGTAQALDVVRVWWGWTAPAPVAPRPTRTVQHRSAVRGICFSAGADSFHALRFSSPPPTVLVTVLGYDVPLAEEGRAASMEADVRAVAAATGTRAVVVRTNLRDHPLHRTTDWGRTHGGALAAVGHALSGEISELAIAASYPRAHPEPWGSHWDLDPCWSSDVSIHHVGEDRWRSEKLADLSTDPVAQQHLRVCWEHRTGAVNCGWCEKCLRTACDLLVAGGLARFPRLPAAEDLPARLDALGQVGASAVVFAHLRDHDIPSELRAAVDGLLARSAAALA
ncbi:MAG: hypothetical protein ACR2JF_08875 [Iamia sp.]